MFSRVTGAGMMTSDYRKHLSCKVKLLCFLFSSTFFSPLAAQLTCILQCRCGLQYIILQWAVLTSGVTHQISDTFIW